MLFDHCTYNLVQLLELDESQHSERTVFIPPPEAGLNQSSIIYRTFKLNPDLIRPQKNFNLRNPNLSAFGIVPGSPMARRTKHEIKVAQRMARKQVWTFERNRVFLLVKESLNLSMVCNTFFSYK